MNNVEITGIVISTDKGYDGLNTSIMDIARTSGVIDTLIVRYPAYYSALFSIGSVVTVQGFFTTRKIGKHKEYYVFASKVERTQKSDQNIIVLDGEIVKKPVHRYTPLGKEISDVLVKNNQDYLPVIYWGDNARFISSAEIGDYIKIKGRIQSREYVKRYTDGTETVKAAYEISVDEIEV